LVSGKLMNSFLDKAVGEKRRLDWEALDAAGRRGHLAEEQRECLEHVRERDSIQHLQENNTVILAQV
jgi:hypothetical protein